MQYRVLSKLRFQSIPVKRRNVNKSTSRFVCGSKLVMDWTATPNDISVCDDGVVCVTWCVAQWAGSKSVTIGTLTVTSTLSLAVLHQLLPIIWLFELSHISLIFAQWDLSVVCIQVTRCGSYVPTQCCPGLRQYLPFPVLYISRAGQFDFDKICPI